MSILDYYTGVVKSLDTTTPDERIAILKDYIRDKFRSYTPYELTITFDSKKINVNAIDDIHDLVRYVLNKFPEFEYFVIREWSNNGIGRLHYHGILNQKSGGQTKMAVLKSTLKRVFGRDCRINYISFYDSYIDYMLKRLREEKSLLQHEWYSSLLLHSFINS